MHTAPTMSNRHGRPSGVRPGARLDHLRAYLPRQRVTFAAALNLAQRQANSLLAPVDIDGAVPIEIMTDLPGLRVEYARQRLPGASFWDTLAKQWVIQLSRTPPWRRQRFTIAHEFKHILDDGHAQLLYHGTHDLGAAYQAELAADHFARCVLVPARALRRAWRAGFTTTDLATLFCVDENVIRDRLREIGLMDSYRQVAVRPSRSGTDTNKAASPGNIRRRPEFNRSATQVLANTS